MANGFFALLSRMRNIARWSLMRNTFTDNVQEHSHMVAVLAHGLALIRRDILGLPAEPDKAAAAALYHDAPEILTGDMPTPVKYFDDELRDAYKRVERVSAEKLISMLPPQLRKSYREAFLPDDKETLETVKAADKLAAYIKCLEELRAGNEEFRQAALSTKAILDKNSRPEVRYFMENFLPAFNTTLDEISL
ncbi:MAG: 5'-deoxynucleotidase [Oscillospiraceae bacterium]|jgi:5'-deoxynucleotidase